MFQKGIMMGIYSSPDEEDYNDLIFLDVKHSLEV